MSHGRGSLFPGIGHDEIAALYRSDHAKLVNLLTRYGSRADAEDGAGEAWAALVRYADRIERTHTFAWLVVAGRNSMFQQRRKLRREYLTSEFSEDTAIHVPMPELLDVANAFAALRPRQQKALAGRVLGFSYAEIQELLGETYTWVNRHVTEGRAAIREAVAA